MEKEIKITDAMIKAGVDVMEASGKFEELASSSMPLISWGDLVAKIYQKMNEAQKCS